LCLSRRLISFYTCRIFTTSLRTHSSVLRTTQLSNLFGKDSLKRLFVAGLASHNLFAAKSQTPQSKADFTLRIAPVSFEIAPAKTIHTLGYNGQVPGPLLGMKEGVPVMVDVFNDTDHGMGRWGRSTSIWNELRRPGSVGRCVILPTASRGIFGGTILAFGRDLGKTMALAMLVGNANRLSLSLFSPADTLAVLLANSFPEAGRREIPVLISRA